MAHIDIFTAGDIVTITSAAGIGRTGYALALAREALAAGQTVLLVDGEGIIDDRIRAFVGVPGFMYAEALDMETAASLVRAAVEQGVDVVIVDSVHRLPSAGVRLGGAAVSLMRLVSFIAGHHGKRPIAFFTVQQKQTPTIPYRMIEEGTPHRKINVHVVLERGSYPNTVDATYRRIIDGQEMDARTFRAISLHNPNHLIEVES